MTHWGWYWHIKKRHQRKNLCSSFLCLDSFQLFKNYDCLGFEIRAAFYELIAKYRIDRLEISTNRGFYVIPVEKQPCFFGGQRYFFHCPKCNKRMRKLYSCEGVFLCRKCLHLGYYTQRVSPATRYSLMQDKIKAQLKQLGGSIIDKPKWMRTHTFSKICNRYWKYDWLREDAFEKEFFISCHRLIISNKNI